MPGTLRKGVRSGVDQEQGLTRTTRRAGAYPAHLSNRSAKIKRHRRTTWEIEEDIARVVKAAFVKYGYGDDVAFEVCQETIEYYEVLVHQDGERGGIGAIDFGVLKEIDKQVEVDAIQPDFRDCFCFEVRVEAD